MVLTSTLPHLLPERLAHLRWNIGSLTYLYKNQEVKQCKLYLSLNIRP